MGSEGFIYALVNPSMPGLVKVGRSTRGADERVRELSGTSTPTPFVVIYEAAFRDCEAAEHLVHTALESLGYRVSPNREFFDAPATAVVDAIRNAKNNRIAKIIVLIARSAANLSSSSRYPLWSVRKGCKSGRPKRAGQTRTRLP